MRIFILFFLFVISSVALLAQTEESKNMVSFHFSPYNQPTNSDRIHQYTPDVTSYYLFSREYASYYERKVADRVGLVFGLSYFTYDTRTSGHNPFPSQTNGEIMSTKNYSTYHTGNISTLLKFRITPKRPLVLYALLGVYYQRLFMSTSVIEEVPYNQSKTFRNEKKTFTNGYPGLRGGLEVEYALTKRFHISLSPQLTAGQFLMPHYHTYFQKPFKVEFNSSLGVKYDF